MRRGPLLIIISLLLAVGAAWIANNWLRNSAAEGAGKVATVSAVVAAIDIPFGIRIENRHLGTIELPVGTVPEGAFADPAAVVGKLARSSMFAGEVILPARLADTAAGSALAYVVAQNMRAVTVRVDDVVGVGGFLLPGNRVDVLASRRINEETVTETILSNIKVLAVDQTASADENKPVVVRAVTLEVSPQQAESLVKGKESGTIQLALRNPEDTSIVLTRKPAPPPTAAPRTARRVAPREPEVTVIRGTDIRRER